MPTHFELSPPPGGNPSISSFINSCITRERFTSSGWLLSKISEMDQVLINDTFNFPLICFHCLHTYTQKRKKKKHVNIKYEQNQY